MPQNLDHLPLPVVYRKAEYQNVACVPALDIHNLEPDSVLRSSVQRSADGTSEFELDGGHLVLRVIYGAIARAVNRHS